MEKVCEFCRALRPAVYCQADCALLCLSCDSKVHSANALSNRHPRSLLCDSCQARPASVRCEEHRMYMCRSCDRSLHSNSIHGSQQQHQKRFIGSYIGCPSAKDFAALWELDLSSSQELVNLGEANLDDSRRYYWQQKGNSSVGSVMSCTTSVCAGMPNAVTNNQQSDKITQNGQKQQQQNQSSQFILQQILDLKRLQLNEGNRFPLKKRSEEEKDEPSSSNKALGRIDQDTDENSTHSGDLEAEFLQSVNSLEELRSEGFSSPFSSLENMPSSSADACPLGDSFWQCRSPLQTSQFMSQNIQDLGICEDLICHDDFNNIPDVDITFQNFEELFGGDQDPNRGLLTNDIDLSCSSVDREISVNKSENSQPHITEDACASSSVYMVSVDFTNSDMPPPKHHRRIQPSYSALSLSSSQKTGAADSLDHRPADLETEENAVTRYQDRKKTRLDGEKARRVLPKDRTDVSRRVKGRLGKSERQNSDDISMRS